MTHWFNVALNICPFFKNGSLKKWCAWEFRWTAGWWGRYIKGSPIHIPLLLSFTDIIIELSSPQNAWSCAPFVEIARSRDAIPSPIIAQKNKQLPMKATWSLGYPGKSLIDSTSLSHPCFFAIQKVGQTHQKHLGVFLAVRGVIRQVFCGWFQPMSCRYYPVVIEGSYGKSRFCW